MACLVVSGGIVFNVGYCQHFHGGRRPCSCGFLRFELLFPHLSKFNIKQIFCLSGSFGEKMMNRIRRLRLLKL